VSTANQFTELADKIGLSDRKTKSGGGKRETPLLAALGRYEPEARLKMVHTR